VVRTTRAVALRANYARGVNYPGQEVVVLSTLIPPLAETWRQLSAESMDHLEVGLMAAPTPSTTVDVAWFSDRSRNRYAFAFPPVATRPTFLNLGGYTVRGAELSLQQRIAARWHLFGGLTLLDASRAQLPYTPEGTFVFGVTGTAGRFRLAVDTQAQSAMYVFGRGRTPVAADLARVDGFAVVNVRPSYRLSPLGDAIEAFVAVENLFDRAYEFRPGYPMPGTSVQVGVTIGRGVR
jgi:iron complex outermembrane receptor protein